MTKTKLILVSASLLLASVFTAHAQTNTTSTTTTTTTDTMMKPHRAADVFGAVAGNWEFILGGGGATDKDFDNSFGGLNFSVGYYLGDAFEVSVGSRATTPTVLVTACSTVRPSRRLITTLALVVCVRSSA